MSEHEPLVMTVPQTLRFLNGPKVEGQRPAISRQTLIRMAESGEIPAHKANGLWWTFAGAAVRNWAESFGVKP